MATSNEQLAEVNKVLAHKPLILAIRFLGLFALVLAVLGYQSHRFYAEQPKLEVICFWISFVAMVSLGLVLTVAGKQLFQFLAKALE